jgi:hypothetical protein
MVESIYKQNKWLPNEESKKRVLHWLLEFNVKLNSELDTKYSKKNMELILQGGYQVKLKRGKN